MKKKQTKIAIIGGGVAGATAAIALGRRGLDVTLYEKEPSLVSGPPFCHLHAGGNLYPDISDEQCMTLLKQSIDFLRFYPEVVDYRPTVIALPYDCHNEVAQLLPRLKRLQEAYVSLIESDNQNEVLGKPEKYYQLYTREMMEALADQEIASQPHNADAWMIPVAKEIDFDKVQFPLILVQEYGLNLFRLSATASLRIEDMSTVKLALNTSVVRIEHTEQQSWQITTVKATNSYDYLINAAGFRTGKIDDMVGGITCKSMVEFKAAYVSQWVTHNDIKFPEIVFHGERGTPRGMGQFTPYPHGYFQLHGMTEAITLYPDGLVASTRLSCQPKLGEDFISKIEDQWQAEETETRTQSAVKHLAKFIPSFSSATVGSKPLFGAQQIPGDDPTLRVAEVSFPKDYYARCEIVKVSSALDMVSAILDNLMALSLIENTKEEKAIPILLEKSIDVRAQKIAVEREYPAALAQRNVRGSTS